MKKLLFAAVLLSACGGKSQEGAKLVEKFNCGNVSVAVTFAPDYESMNMDFDGKTYKMKRKVSASGMKFATPDDKAWYWSKGDDVDIKTDGIIMECR
ncbi:MAG: MliC family protein [Rickettsiales bacterium]|jgi:membrane-bound inhibitor of C-type lysozyme|nr:MliC family protein [Rickettsiales bacterium]